MEGIVWDSHPVLRDPTAVVAFEGWGDAGSASSLAVDTLLELGSAERFAVIDCDDFFDFQVQRPLVELDEGGARELIWPDSEFYSASMPGAERDLVILTGHEPHARWKAYSRRVVEVLRAVGVTQVVTMGAFIGQVPHTLPVPLVGVATEPGVLERHHLFTSNYEGPTGVVGVLNQALAAAEIPIVSVWAAVPHYLSNQEYPPGGLALLDKAMEIAGMQLDTSELSADAADFRRQVDAAVENSELGGYVKELEGQTLTGEEGVDPAERLVEEIERYLRGG